MKYPKLLSSSVDPQALSLTVKGVIVGAIPVVGFVVQLLGINLPGDVINDLAESVGNTILQIGAAVSAIMVVIGVVRKILVAVGWVKVK